MLAPCGNRRAAVCPACSDRYAADAYHLLRAGLAGDDDKGVPTTVAEHPRAFLTLTAPSFGPVHTRKITRRGHVIPCRCGDRHHPADPRLGTPLDPDSYDYAGAVLWQAHAGRCGPGSPSPCAAPSPPRSASGAGTSPTTPGCPTPRSPSTSAAGSSTSTPSSASTAPTDPPTHPRPGSPTDVLRDAITAAAQPRSLTTARPDGTPLVLGWGAQLDLRPSPRPRPRQLEDERRARSPTPRLAGYIAKYATKATGAVDAAKAPTGPSATARTSPTSTSPRTTAA